MNLHEKMNEYLANQQVMYTKLHNLHWFVTGSSFFALHVKFEELFDQTADIIDSVGERLLALGVMPIASMKKCLEVTKVKEFEDKFISGTDAVKSLLIDISYWIKDSKEIADLAAEKGDDVTSDMFNEYLKEYEKLQWMFTAFNK